MSDEPRGEETTGPPSRRALGAMESAVRRARESGAQRPLPTPAATSGGVQRAAPDPPATAPVRPGGDAVAAQGTKSPVDIRQRWLIAAVAVVAALVLAGAIALAAAPGSSPRVAGGPPATGIHSGTPGPSSRPSTTIAKGSPPASTTTTTTAVASTPGAMPVISALDPASGTAGQAIGVSGANFLSSTGQIVATFNGQVAPTSCPSQNACSVTVPPLPQASTAQVTITTSSGTSNAVTFTYT